MPLDTTAYAIGPDQVLGDVRTLQSAMGALSDLSMAALQCRDTRTHELVRDASVALSRVLHRVLPADIEREAGRNLTGRVMASMVPDERLTVGKENGRNHARENGHRLSKWRTGPAVPGEAGEASEAHAVATCAGCKELAHVLVYSGRPVLYQGPAADGVAPCAATR